MLLVSQPQQSEDESPTANLDPVIHIVRTEDMSLVWKGRLQTKGRIDWISNGVWIPGNQYVALEGHTPETVRMLVIQASDGKVIWEKSWRFEGFGASTYMSYDPFQKVLLVREKVERGLRAYRIPDMKSANRYTAEETRQGCCVIHSVSWSRYGVAAIGWETRGGRYHLIIWESGNPQGRTMRLPYNYEDTAFDLVVWGPRDEIAALLIPATGASSDVYSLVFMDVNSGNVRRTITERDFPMVGLAWLEGRGWLLGSDGGQPTAVSHLVRTIPTMRTCVFATASVRT